jgi:elongation factor 2
LIDSPGHVDFSSEVTAALRVTDGALVVVDSVEGCRAQTETVLRQALQERIKPVLMVNKLDRCIVEVQYSPEECYKNLVQIIESANVIISNYHDEEIESRQVDPVAGTVAFGSGKMGWAFTLLRFARIYAAKFNTSAEKLVKKLWGDHYYCPVARKWQKTPVSQANGKTLQRGFCEFVLEPIYKIFNEFSTSEEGTLSNDLWNMIEKLGVTLTSEERNRENKEVHRVVMQKFLPAAETLVEVIVTHLPSPVVAQKYRYHLLYTGPVDDKYAQAIANCDPNGPLMVFISKMVPTANGGRFVAFGRVFSGTLTQGQKVRILGPEYVAGSQKDVYHANITRATIMMGRNIEAVNECSAGDVIGLGGVDKYIVKTCTLTDEGKIDAAPIRNMKYSVSAVVQVAVEAVNPSDIGKLVEGLKRLAKADSLVQVSSNESGQHIVSGAGELHLEICLNDLENEHCKGIKIKRSKPVVSFTETVTSKSDACLAKSANKLNRIYITAEPLSEDLTQDLENGVFSMNDDVKTRSKILVEKHDWSVDETRKVWAVGPGETTGSNILVDCTKGVDYLNDVHDYIVDAFQLATRNSVLAEEPMRGVRFNIVDITLHTDSSHRGGRQITPMARKAFYASALSAGPRLVEPVYSVEIQTHESVMGGIYSVINKRRGQILGTEQNANTPIYSVKSTVPVLESFGLTEELRGATGGQAFPQMAFDHWSIIQNDPLEEGSKSNDLVTGIRTRKGLKASVPILSDYLDRL